MSYSYTSCQACEMALLALAVWREARGECYEAKRGVAWSIRNRVTAKPPRWWGSTWATVILKPWQYSSFDAKDPNVVKFPDPVDWMTDQVWQECLAAAEEAHQGNGADPTAGATHYYDASIPPPTWTQGARFCVHLGALFFYKDVP